MTEVITEVESDPTDEQRSAAVQASKDLERRKGRASLMAKTRERRTLQTEGLQLRSEGADGALTLEGYACLTGVKYDMGFYSEEVAPGAFRRTLSEGPDVQLLVNHGMGGSLPLARTVSGTLSLEEDHRGLRVTASLDPEDPDVQSLKRKMDRGDIDQMSFAFQVTSDQWAEGYDERVIRSVSIHRGDVSVVNQAASPTTFATLRSVALDALAETSGEQFVTAMTEWRDHTLLPMEQRAGKALSASTMETLSQVLNLIATADEAVDDAQPLLADLMGVPNPDDDEAADDGSDDAEPDDGDVPDDAGAARAVLPDYTTTARERVALLRARGAR